MRKTLSMVAVHRSGGVWRLMALMLLLGSLLTPTALAAPVAEALLQNGSTVCLPFVLGGSPVPMLSAPIDGAVLSTIAPRFAWAAQTTTAQYLVLQVSPSATFTPATEFVLTKTLAHAGSYQLAQNLDPGATYYWRAAWQADASPSSRWAYSAARTFTTGSGGVIPPAPTLSFPPDGMGIELSALRPYVLVKWLPVAEAVEYLVVAQERPNPLNGGLSQVVPDGQRYEAWVVDIEYDVRVMADSDWDWYVITRNDYAVSEPSPTWYFYVN